MPKHADEEMWAAAGSLHLYFNVSGIHARDGYQLYVISAKIRLFKYAEVSLPIMITLQTARHVSRLAHLILES